MDGNLRHVCADDGCYMNTLWDWSPLNDCFEDSGIRVSDVDGIVERKGQFLLLDGKRVNQRGQRELSTGQRRLYKRFAENGGHVIVFHGQPPQEVEYVRQWLPGGDFLGERPCDLAGLQKLVSAWFTIADQAVA